ncbi:CheY-like chemotaxis protein [Filimonas zeae]|uniref:Two-component system response regulator n=1 Tax=Filimonas zeae TaxID=1737353 RepID=A0A917ISE2_9BACT|nr:response regulator [Filimonas zeae]MDR6338029.1 CheY-like chemotaxis protein [Filimonas zeae]GGH61369.1 two-component system response regulator [Filimonas zeae]
MAEEPTPITCFIVDDDEDDQEVFAAAMDKTGFRHYRCIFAGDGAEAMEKLSADFQPDFIFLDLNMPRLNGIQCLCEIRKQAHLQLVPVAIYTTSADDSSKTQAFELGANAFIAKPTRFSELVNRLNEYFTTHGPVRANQ